MSDPRSIETILSHAGLLTDPSTGAISTPIYQTATFGHPALGQSTGFDYSRTANPTRSVLEKILAEIECGVASSTFASGMAAIASLQALFHPGDKVLISDDLYGGTYRLFEKVLKPWGLNIEYCDFSDLVNIEKTTDALVRAFFIESPTNPLMKITDLRKVISFARSRNILVIVDNTFMTPYCQRPLTLGADIVVHSGTKLLSGHNDTLFGAVISKNFEIAEKIAYIQNATGGVVSPFDSWLAIRGIKTLAIRVDRAQENATKIAMWLTKRKGVRDVYFPGLPDHPGNKIHFSQASGSGAMISFRLTSKNAAHRVINSVKTITFAESLGGVESLITYPITQTHAEIPESMRKQNGITDDLARLSVGIENYKDLITDLDQAIG
jgi:cystathionine beta-lyase/cystathionine gamma-synthase